MNRSDKVIVCDLVAPVYVATFGCRRGLNWHDLLPSVNSTPGQSKKHRTQLDDVVVRPSCCNCHVFELGHQIGMPLWSIRAGSFTRLHKPFGNTVINVFLRPCL